VGSESVEAERGFGSELGSRPTGGGVDWREPPLYSIDFWNDLSF